MKCKVFICRLSDLEDAVNAWLEAKPGIIDYLVQTQLDGGVCLTVFYAPKEVIEEPRAGFSAIRVH